MGFCKHHGEAQGISRDQPQHLLAAIHKHAAVLLSSDLQTFFLEFCREGCGPSADLKKILRSDGSSSDLRCFCLGGGGQFVERFAISAEFDEQVIRARHAGKPSHDLEVG